MKHLSSNKGFTLIEVLISVAIAGILLAGVVTTMSLQQRNSETQSQLLEIQANLRAGLNDMTNELMMAGYNASPHSIVVGITGPSSPFANPSGSMEFTYNMDPNADPDDDVSAGTADTADTTITYALNANGELTKNENGNVNPLASDIDSLEFEFFQSDGTTAATTLDEIRMIRITIDAKIDDAVVYGGGSTRTLSVDVTPRNLAAF